MAGGAERIASQLRFLFQRNGHKSWMIVGHKFNEDKNIFEFPKRDTKWLLPLSEKVHTLPRFRGRNRLANLLGSATTPISSQICRALGIEDFEFPGSKKIDEILPEKPDICHAHNLHRDYFDLRQLPNLSKKYPLLITLHDAWLLSGHCAHSFACERWITGCGHCPDLSIYPEILHDATAYNWKRKQKIYQQSQLYVATPSQWLLDKVKNSILNPTIQISKVIPNGIDLSIFHPTDQIFARSVLGFPQHSWIILAVGNALLNNPWKDYVMMETAVQMACAGMLKNRIIFLVLGQDLPSHFIGNVEYRFVKIQNNPGQLALYYQAADVYIHAARVDTFPTTVLESMACGCPVIATKVGGIPEQIVEGETGFLVPLADAPELARKLKRILEDANLRQYFGRNSAEVVLRNFNQDKMVNSYLTYYDEILQHRIEIDKK